MSESGGRRWVGGKQRGRLLCRKLKTAEAGGPAGVSVLQVGNGDDRCNGDNSANYFLKTLVDTYLFVYIFRTLRRRRLTTAF